VIAKLVALYEQGEITASHLVVEALRLLDPANPVVVLEALPEDVLPRVLEYAREYRPGKMRTNYGLQPTVDQVEAARKWIEDHAPPESAGEAARQPVHQPVPEAG
jgi:hypothetical protein